MSFLRKLSSVILTTLLLSFYITVSHAFDEELHSLPEWKIMLEIKKLQFEIRDLENSGLISNATAIMTASILTTVVVGVVHSNLTHYFFPSDYIFKGQLISELSSGLPMYINAILLGIINSILPGAAIGGLLAVIDSKNEDIPRIPQKDSFWLGLSSAIATCGLWELGIGIGHFSAWLGYAGVWNVGYLNALGFVSASLGAIALFSNISTQRSTLQAKKLKLEYRLAEAEFILRKRLRTRQDKDIEKEKQDNETVTFSEQKSGYQNLEF